MPRTVEAHIGNPDFTGGTWALVSIDLSKLSGKVRRVNITLPERLLNVLDRYATEHGETRSGLIARATMRYIAQQDD